MRGDQAKYTQPCARADVAGPGSGSSPVVSVVIPAYNRERFIGSCIDSALKQDFHSFEVIVVDDGSTDGTADVCRSYGGKIRYFRKPNGGAASALNYGIKKMEGGWFKWLSSDDELEDGALRALMSGAGEGAAGVVYGDFTKIDSRGSVIGRHRERSFASQDEFVLGLWWHFAGSAGAAVVRRDCFDRVGLFDEKIRYAEDYDWWLRAALVHGIAFRHVPRPVARYRIHPGQITREKLESTSQLRSQIKRNVASLVLERAMTDARYRKYYAAATKRYRAVAAPVAAGAALLAKLPGGDLVEYWGGRLIPRLSSMAYWASYPPYDPDAPLHPAKD